MIDANLVRTKVLEFLTRYWLIGAGFMAAALTLLVPVLIGNAPGWLVLIFMATPAYMIHQLEEHIDDRFRSFVNERLFGGRDVLTSFDIIWINVGVVWGLNLLALYWAGMSDPGWGLMAAYLLLVNAAIHIAVAVQMKGAYNPGLYSACGLFVPLGIATIIGTPSGVGQHLFGLLVAVGAHAAIAVLALRRGNSLPSVGTADIIPPARPSEDVAVSVTYPSAASQDADITVTAVHVQTATIVVEPVDDGTGDKPSDGTASKAVGG